MEKDEVISKLNAIEAKIYKELKALKESGFCPTKTLNSLRWHFNPQSDFEKITEAVNKLIILGLVKIMPYEDGEDNYLTIEFGISLV